MDAGVSRRGSLLVTRRSLLCLLVAATASASSHARVAGTGEESDALLVELGASIRTALPDVFVAVDRRLPHLRGGSRVTRAAEMLDRDRVRQELMTGDVLVLDGWVLAASEVRAAVAAVRRDRP
jgi:hypothetical protein